jgi:hypothetical protein
VRIVMALAAIAAAAILATPRPAAHILRLAPGVTELHSEMQIASATEVVGSRATVLRAAADFHGHALIVVRGGGVRLRHFAIDGNRAALEQRTGLPGSNVTFAAFTCANGVLVADSTRVAIEDVRFRNIAGFAVLVTNSHAVTIDRVHVTDSGSRNPAGHNNTTGGILFEEGTTDFRVTNSVLRSIRGNGIWTHSLYTSPRNARGDIALNRFENIGRDALQVGHATDVSVHDNRGSRIGFPLEDVDMESLAVPAALDTAGNVERSSYLRNEFTDVNGKCIDLDGFHDGDVRGNACINRMPAANYPFGNYGIVMNNSNPDMQSRNIRIEQNRIEGARFGGIFVIGSGNRVTGNRLLNLNGARCGEPLQPGCNYAPSEPDMLRSGIYLGAGAARPAPAHGNIVEGNEVTGFGMDKRCIGFAPGVLPSWNTVRENRCRAQ